MPLVNSQIRLARRPLGLVTKDDFRFEESVVHSPSDGKALVENLYLSLDPTNRPWMNDGDGYMPPVKIGEVMRGITIGVIRESRCSAFKVGDIVTGLHGWQNFAEVDETNATLVPEAVRSNLPAALSIFGLTGLTAYFGLLDIGKPQAGECVVVSAAAGAVGSIVGQIAKIKGCYVVGIAGGKEKCDKIVEDFGFDVAIDYKSENILTSLKKHCPKGIDIYFDNVGGEILDAVLQVINIKARIPFCGMISAYNADKPVPGPYNYVNLIFKRAKVEGFLFSDYTSRFAEGVSELAKWLQEGKLRYEVDIVDGLENAPLALNRLFDGSNKGKLLIRIKDET